MSGGAGSAQDTSRTTSFFVPISDRWNRDRGPVFFFSPSPRVGLVAIKNIKMPGDEIYRFMPAILKFTKEYKRVCSRAVWGNFANPFQDLRCLCEQGNGGISHGSISKAQKFSVKGFGRSTWD